MPCPDNDARGGGTRRDLHQLLPDFTLADFIRALRDGKRPDGTAIKEAMPWKAYGQMSDAELKAIYAYLRTVPPVPKGDR